MDSRTGPITNASLVLHACPWGKRYHMIRFTKWRTTMSSWEERAYEGAINSTVKFEFWESSALNHIEAWLAWLTLYFTYFFLVKQVKCSAIFYSLPKQLNLVLCLFPVLTVYWIIWQFCCTIEVIFWHITNFFRFKRWIIRDYSQSETDKYFELIRV